MEKLMQGALFLNDKQGNEARPDFKGKITLDDGKVLRVSAWKNVSKAGQPFISCKCDWVEETPKDDSAKDAWAGLDAVKSESKQEKETDTDDQIPF